jgi:eukaryotic-like serine/threonine-protein kinase
MPPPGAILAGRYRIIAPLGAGGMATVQRARDERLERDVAVKILLPNHAGDPVLAARFEREARSLAAAAHPGVVAVFDVDPGDPAAGVEPFFVMELCPGGSLADRLSDGQRLSPDELIPIIISVADGLAGLHAAGVVHRDVKPSNILLAPARAKLADFGLARSDDPEASGDLTAPGTAVGTMGYLAPDVLAGATPGPPGDIYALGVAAFTGLTGSMPRPAGSIAELVAAGGQPPPLVSSAAPDLGIAFDKSVAAALDPDPAKRPDAMSFAESLTSALGRWSRARSSPRSVAVPAATDLDATTAVVQVPTPAVHESQPTGWVTVSPVPHPRVSRGNLITAAVLGGLIVIAIALASGRSMGPGVESSAGASSVASSSPSQGPSASPAQPTAATAPSVADRALAALVDVDSAIDAIRNSEDLKNKEVNDLQKRAREIRSALERGDLDAAAKAADGLSTAAGKLGDQLDEDLARRLDGAVRAVVDILRDR